MKNAPHSCRYDVAPLSCRYDVISLYRNIERRLFLVAAMFFLLTSCEYKELCYDHNHWTRESIAFDWSKSFGAQPKGMTALIYNVEKGSQEPIRYDLVGMLGGEIRLLPGTYQTLAYNYDTETILYRGMDRVNTLEAYTRVSSVEEGTRLTRSGMPRAVESEYVILEPDTLWAGVSTAKYMEHADSLYKIWVTPEPRFVEVDITITNVPNLQYTGQFGGALSGLAPSVYMSTGELGEGCATQAFTCSVVDATTLQMKFRIFGHCPHHDEGITNQHMLTIYAILADGSKWYYTQNVTDQMHSPSHNPDAEHVNIELDEIPVPKPIVNGSGFQPTIDGWQGVEIDVGM